MMYQNSEDKNSIIIKCGCFNHLIELHALGSESDNTEVGICFYTYENEPRILFNIWKRIKGACRYLWNGKAFNQEIIMSLDEAKVFSNKLKEIYDDARN